MPSAEEVIATFERSKYGRDWFGDVAYPFWGGLELYTIIEIKKNITQPSPRQLALLDQLLRYPTNIRPEVEAALFDHYQNDIYGSVMELGEIDNWEELTPKLKTSSQIWDILGEPTVAIPSIDDDAPEDGVRVRLSYIDCPWDEEHGFGIQLQDWKIESFGGEFA